MNSPGGSQFKGLRQSGNVMLAVFAAIAAVGVVGATSMNIMKGPVRAMHNVTQRSLAENSIIASSKLAVMATSNLANGGDCDGDNTVEPIAWSMTGSGPKPTGGGYLPANIGASLQDPWGNTYGYCVWDHGAAIQTTCPTPTQRLRGVGTGDSGPVIAIISSGPDRTFQTSCANAPTYVAKVSGSDDIVLSYTYAEAQAASGGLWYLQSSDLNTAEIKKDLEVKNTADEVVFGVDSTTDVGKPSIKVDYVKALNNSSVEFLSNISLGSSWLSGDGGNEGLFIDGAGNVGIGTAEPAKGVQIEKQANAAEGLLIRNAGTGTSAQTALMLRNNAGSQANFGLTGSNYTGAPYAVNSSYWNSDSPSGLALAAFGAAGTIRFHTSPSLSERMRIAANGSVGIGTAAPVTKLHVNGDIRTDGQNYYFGAGQHLYGDNSSALSWNSNHSTVTQMNFLDAEGTSYGRIYGSGDGAQFGLMDGDGNWSYLAVKDSDTRFYINNAIAMRLFPTYLDMYNHRITRLGDPTAGTDAANKSYVDSKTGANESDPQVGTLNGNDWCRANSSGTSIICDRNPPVLTETDPIVGTLTNGRWCRAVSGKVVCDQSTPVAAETDPQVATVTNGKWCRGNGSAVVCDQNAPSGGGLGTTVPTSTTCAAPWTSSSFSQVSCYRDASTTVTLSNPNLVISSGKIVARFSMSVKAGDCGSASCSRTWDGSAWSSCACDCYYDDCD